jgi:hypothetical protein
MSFSFERVDPPESKHDYGTDRKALSEAESIYGGHQQFLWSVIFLFLDPTQVPLLTSFWNEEKEKTR